MNYTFEILGVLPIIQFFNYQQQSPAHENAVDYIGSPICTLDAFLGSLETTTHSRDWDLARVAATVITFWMHNQEIVQRWQRRLNDAGQTSLVVARVGHVQGLQQEFERLLLKG